jgi:hypothetical protein
MDPAYSLPCSFEESPRLHFRLFGNGLIEQFEKAPDGIRFLLRERYSGPDSIMMRDHGFDVRGPAPERNAEYDGIITHEKLPRFYSRAAAGHIKDLALVPSVIKIVRAEIDEIAERSALFRFHAFPVKHVYHGGNLP